MTRQRTVTFATALYVLIMVGCHGTKHAIPVQPPYTVFRSPNLWNEPPRRVLVLPVVSTVFDGGYSERWYRLFTSELRTIKRFEVVTTSLDAPGVLRCIEQARAGLFAEEDLILLRDQFRVDGVLFVEMSEFDPYWPPRMAVRVNLVDTYRAETLASLDGNWDGRDERIRVMIRDLGQHVTTANELGNPDLFFQSPEYFGKFVARDISLALCKLFRNDLLQLANAEEASSGSCAHPSGNMDQADPYVTGEPPEQADPFVDDLRQHATGPPMPKAEELPAPAANP